MNRLADKVCLITGSTGIAAATAELAAREGALLFICSRTAEHGEALVARLQDLSQCLYVPADLKDANQARRAVRRCVRRFKRIDVVFNVAGISGRSLGDGPVHECTDQGWDQTLATNLKSLFLVCREAIGQMLKQPIGPEGLRGTILNMTSVLGFSPSPRHFGTHAYAASKAAIIGLTKAMAAYYAPWKIRVNGIAPALVRTPMSARAQESPGILEFMQSKQPLAKGFMEPGEIAQAALFLMSSESRWITGDILTVDAGWCVSDGRII